MFHSGSPSPYSSFFMSGFQHASHSAPNSSISPSFPIEEDDWFTPDFRRRGSLPTDESASLEKQLSVRKPKSTRERSWLSLDLARQRTSSLRSMPSPKPAPSVSLPALPTSPASPTPSSVLMPVSPKKVSNPPTPRSSTSRVSFLPLSSSPLKPTSSAIKPPSVIVPNNLLARSNSTLTKKTTSTVSTRYRRAKRTDALARLEGKTSHWEGRFSWYAAPTRKNSIKRSYNFMSMSDDEGESDLEEEDSFFDLGFEFPSPPESHHRSHSSPDVPTSPVDNTSVWITSPVSPISQTTPFHMPAFTLSRAPTNKRRRSKTLSQVLPGLTSFIDLEKENAGHTKRDSKRWRGRSFIEISSL